MTAAWGEAGAETEEGSVSGRIDLGGGSYMVVNHDAIQRILRSQEMSDAVERRAKALAEAANAAAIHVGRTDRPDPHYVAEVSNEGTRARARVWPQNYQAVLDDALHSTLLKVMAAQDSGAAGELHGAEAWGDE